MINAFILLAAVAASGCAFVEVRDGERVSRGLQVGGIAAPVEARHPVSVKRWVAGFWASPGQVSVGFVREVAWIVPMGQSCMFQGSVGDMPAGGSR